MKRIIIIMMVHISFKYCLYHAYSRQVSRLVSIDPSKFIRKYTSLSRNSFPEFIQDNNFGTKQPNRLFAAATSADSRQTYVEYPSYEKGKIAPDFHAMIIAVRNKDFDTIMNLYMKEKEKGLIPKRLTTYSHLLSVCTKRDHLARAITIFNDMMSMRLTPNESTFLSGTLIRCYSQAGEIETALALVKQMKELGITPKLRSYMPMIEVLSANGEMTKLVDLAMHMSRSKIDLTSELMGLLFETFAKYMKLKPSQDVDFIHKFLETSSQGILGLEFQDMTRIVAALSSNNPSHADIEKQGILVESTDIIIQPEQNITETNNSIKLEKSISEIDGSEEVSFVALNAMITNSENLYISEITRIILLSSCFRSLPMDDATRVFVSQVPQKYVIKQGKLDENKLRARVVDISHQTCHCPNCGAQLRQLFLTENEKLLVRIGLMKICSAVSLKQWTHLQAFAKWLELNNDYTYILDGANIAYSNQNYNSGRFSFKQIEVAVDKLLERGEKVLVLLPKCYTKQNIPNSIQRQYGGKSYCALSAEDKRILTKLQDIGMYVVPNGADDDWYWMYATVSTGRTKPAYVVTNDLMRDHKLAFLEPRPFTRWRMAHVINFHLTETCTDLNTDFKISFFDPVKYSREIQRTTNGRWHFPSTDRQAWICTDISLQSP